jgi:hypothetical protein
MRRVRYSVAMIPLLPPISKSTPLKLTHHDVFPTGVVLLRYDVIGEKQ